VPGVKGPKSLYTMHKSLYTMYKCLYTIHKSLYTKLYTKYNSRYIAVCKRRKAGVRVYKGFVVNVMYRN
jgi:hypothetical protein